MSTSSSAESEAKDSGQEHWYERDFRELKRLLNELVDVPSGDSGRRISIEIQQAIYTDDAELDLPREVKRAMTQWLDAKTESSSAVRVDCLWEDPAQSITLGPLSTKGDGQRVLSKPVVGKFPFKLPQGFTPSP